MTASRLCPICHRPLASGEERARFRPFCSKRCADIDLGRWLKGSYAVPAAPLDDESETGAEGEDAEGPPDAVSTKPLRH